MPRPVSMFARTSPLIFTYLLHRIGSHISPAFYVALSSRPFP